MILTSDHFSIEILKPSNRRYVGRKPGEDKNIFFFRESFWTETAEHTKATSSVTVLRYLSESVFEFCRKGKCLVSYLPWPQIQAFRCQRTGEP
jgi:hypothetical protein